MCQVVYKTQFYISFCADAINLANFFETFVVQYICFVATISIETRVTRILNEMSIFPLDSLTKLLSDKKLIIYLSWKKKEEIQF